MEKINILFKGELTDQEYMELVSLEYVLTWGYTDDYNSDLSRHKQLTEKKDGED